MQFGLKLLDQVWLEDLGSLASIVKVHFRDVPSADLKLAGFYHRDEFFDWFVHVSERPCCRVILKSYVSSGTLGERPIEVSALDSILSFPGEFLLVGKNTSDEG